MNGHDLASIGGIVVLTMAIVEILKRKVVWRFARSGMLPTWIWAVLVSIALTAVARLWLGTLSGNVWILLAQAITSAATAGGFVEWWRSLDKPSDASAAAYEARYLSTEQMRRTSGYKGTLSILLVGLLAVVCSGCVGQYVEADRATFDAIAPEYLGYVENDTRLTPDQVARRQRTVETWRMRIEASASSSPLWPGWRAPATRPTTRPWS